MKRRIIALCCLLMMLVSCALAEASPAPTAAAAPDMLAIDHRLYELGYRDSACTGEMNAAMLNAIRNFQTANKLPVSGEADAATIALLMSDEALGQREYIAAFASRQGGEDALANGSYGDGVLALQQRLTELGYFTGACDGAYGKATEEAVCRFQLANGLQETGVADRSVSLRLYADDARSWDAFLEESCASAGESGAHVRRIQLWLKHMNYFRGACTGRYGDGTQQAVKRFQQDMGLETSGDVDLATSIALFSDIESMRSDMEAIRRGESGTEADQLCMALKSLGYPAGDSFDMQTELAVMQFQHINGIEISGVADGVTLARIGHPSVLGASAFQPENAAVHTDTESTIQIARQAASLLGQQSGFSDGFSFVSYVYLRCGLPLLQPDQLRMEPISDRSSVHAGQALVVKGDETEICGIATADGALIYADSSGFIVMRYLDMMNWDTIYGSSMEAAQ